MKLQFITAYLQLENKMSSSASTSVVPNVNVEQDSHFMRLPTEIREIIYRPLLIARHAMMEPNVTSDVVSLPTSDSFAYTNNAA